MDVGLELLLDIRQIMYYLLNADFLFHNMELKIDAAS